MGVPENRRRQAVLLQPRPEQNAVGAPEEGFITLDDDDEEVEEEGSSSSDNEVGNNPYIDPSAGYDDEPSAPGISVSKAVAAPRTTSKRRICRWEMKKTASFGAGQGVDAGDVYYLNKETGETVWEKPDDYFDESAVGNLRKVESLAEITEETTLADGFEILEFMTRERTKLRR